MLTKNILLGMNLLSLAGFAVMGLTLSLQRYGKVQAPVAFALMAAGTALLVVGLYVAVP
jgi:hypothetical protein